MNAGAITRTMPKTYFKLVKQFPLIHIRDNAHLDEAQAIIDELLWKDLDEGGQAYLDALMDLVGVYEDENVSIPTAPPAGVLHELMSSHRLSQHDLAKKVGIAQSTISAIVTGRRSFTSDHIIKLAGFFNVSPAVFLPA